MTKDEFLHKFKLRQLERSSHGYRYASTLRQAAVLIVLIDDKEELNVLLTKRAIHLRHHPGQVSFPGGKHEPEDIDSIATALREAHEEIGLSPKYVNVIGQLHPYQTISGYIVTPIIALIGSGHHFTKDENEVSEIFQVPLQHFLNTENHLQVTVYHQSKPHQVPFMPYNQYNIWGATAAMLKDLALHLT
ncbi:MAG: 8-oxo-dGTP pyrophosphatase MutT (NUDIX family) [Alteromonadaceae bacterium]|jgi:8-oxo-dGTP pyrophosphatase MutT (NUDIX family)